MPTTTRYITEKCICIFILRYLGAKIPVRTICDIDNPINYIRDIYDNVDDEIKNSILDRLKTVTILDPTCGTGAFIFQAFSTLLDIYKRLGIFIDQNIVKDIFKNNLFGVDIDQDAIEILKFRALILMNSFGIDELVYENFKIGNTVHDVSFSWAHNFSNGGKFDIIIGNPPYIELSKTKGIELDDLRTIKCGNLYAPIMEKSITYLLSDNGVLGYIVPISIATTPRMSLLREIVYRNSAECFYSHYADRPGCLFSGVHQKLTICILTKGNLKSPVIYTSKYSHWEKDDEPKMFQYVAPFLFRPLAPDDAIPKISSSIEESILNKINKTKKNILTETIKKGGHEVWLNMRMCFWCKAFMESKGSNEYKSFSFESLDDAKIFAAFLNSSLFFFIWEAISDCWHITSKVFDILNFSIKEIDTNLKKDIIFAYDNFSDALEQSKKFIGSKQTDYIYQHKLHKKLIDKIDDSFAKVFDFSKEELNFIKNYQVQYRLNTEHQKPLTVIDVFSGAGGLSLGFEHAGYDIALANEIDSQIALTYRCNHKKTLMLNCDIKEFVDNPNDCIDRFAFSNPRVNVLELKNKLRNVDVVIGGPPCQGFSMAGERIRHQKAIIEDPRNYLFTQYFRIIQKYEPKYFVFENVVGLLSSGNGKIIETIKEIFRDNSNFKKGGYHLNIRVFDASNFGVPQKRKRVLIIGSKAPFDLDKAIDETLNNLEPDLQAKFTRKTTVRDAIFDLASKVDDKTIPNHKATIHSAKAIERMCKILPNQNFTSLKENIKSVHSGSYGRLDWDKPAMTITTRFDTPSAGRYIHPEANRTLTQREAARLQTFPDDFIFYGNKTSICKQIGNAVPPLLAEFIARLILHLENKRNETE